MNRLLDPPGIKMTVQRMVCTSCGAEANASRTCGVAYVPKSVRAAEAVKANPEKSNRAIAAEIGVSEPTVRLAREQGTSCDAPEKVVGKDGKSYAAKRPAAADHMREARTGADSIWNQAWKTAQLLNETPKLLSESERRSFGNKMLDTYPWLGWIEF
jgi:hypothetical protein